MVIIQWACSSLYADSRVGERGHRAYRHCFYSSPSKRCHLYKHNIYFWHLPRIKHFTILRNLTLLLQSHISYSLSWVLSPLSHFLLTLLINFFSLPLVAHCHLMRILISLSIWFSSETDSQKPSVVKRIPSFTSLPSSRFLNVSVRRRRLQVRFSMVLLTT